MMSMITVDIDTDSPYEALKCFFNISYFFSEVRIRQSARKGYHLKAFCKEKLSFDTVIDLRLAFGDDLNRVALDCDRRFRGKPKQILFSQKGKDKAGKWYDCLKPVPKPFKNSRIRPTKFRS
jgi:hypothetical protein